MPEVVILGIMATRKVQREHDFFDYFQEFSDLESSDEEDDVVLSNEPVSTEAEQRIIRDTSEFELRTASKTVNRSNADNIVQVRRPVSDDSTREELPIEFKCTCSNNCI